VLLAPRFIVFALYLQGTICPAGKSRGCAGLFGLFENRMNVVPKPHVPLEPVNGVPGIEGRVPALLAFLKETG
jgi:hypothetical protein